MTTTPDAANLFIAEVMKLADEYAGVNVGDLRMRISAAAEAHGFESSDYLGELARRIHQGYRGFSIFDF